MFFGTAGGSNAKQRQARDELCGDWTFDERLAQT
jgi:hypothetical protein